MSFLAMSTTLRRFVIIHWLAVICEWAVIISMLVLVHDRSGTTAMGLTSLALLAAYAAAAPFTGQMIERRSPTKVRLLGLTAQVAGYTIAAITAYLAVSVWATVGATMLATAAMTTMRPTGAVVLPALARSTRELTTANLWVGHGESASVLIGPLVATAMFALDGARFALAGTAVLAVVALLIECTLDMPRFPPARDNAGVGALRLVGRSARWVWGQPGPRGVLAAAIGRYLIVGTIDLVVVLLAAAVLDAGDAGAGMLSVCFGAGAAAMIAASTIIVRRPKLAPYIMLAVAATIAASALAGMSVTLLTVLIALPTLGAAQALLNLLPRMLLQRSAPPDRLASLFALLEVSAGVGLIVGSGLAQTLIAVAGARGALLGLATLFTVLAASTARSLRLADDHADVPVVAMSLLRSDPVFEPLPALELEVVARSAIDRPVTAGELVVRQGDTGDEYFLVADGVFEVTVDERPVRELGRGASFGEIALLGDVARTATVRASSDGHLLVVGREPFLVAVTGYESARRAAWAGIDDLEFGEHRPVVAHHEDDPIRDR